MALLGTAPRFWWREPGLASRALAAPALAYGWVAQRNLERGARVRVPLPVLCVGNWTVGGGGKTPTAQALGRAALAMGHRPGFLSRGHGGAARSPLLVDPSQHSADLVGDEPLLLAGVAPTAIAPDRAKGAELLRQAGCDLIIMDDGFQSARLHVDVALLVADARRGLGNGRVLPAGPLRAPLGSQLAHADAAILIGVGAPGEALAQQLRDAGLPLYRATLGSPNAGDFAGRRVLAFAGIADPEKFYASLKAAGAEIVATRSFPDHHMFKPDDARELLAEADSLGLDLVTTAKDRARFQGRQDGPMRGLSRLARVLDVEVQWIEAETAEALLRQAFARFSAR
ncbi:tetraacyldisaccharide 4'-kinase [Aureimonas ureilytica]|uniref:Tetraacyldisaccharide 4'-kinase n=1 Tax=Aureimonas ureilytica TaxID=401562 RepID=A0A175RKM5_9HYPH|nr:tetraacyldisaccharide 4'-kinase [Aureimonas ureilytica]KTR03913.1 tetraacyldisaccharide 4'-kinase [Aureimonas ureilytica]